MTPQEELQAAYAQVASPDPNSELRTAYAKTQGLLPSVPVASAPSAGWQSRVKPIDIGGGKTSVQREGDKAVWYGPEHGNTNPKGGWFDAHGNQVGDSPTYAPVYNGRGGYDQNPDADLITPDPPKPAGALDTTKRYVNTGFNAMASVGPAANNLVAHGLDLIPTKATKAAAKELFDSSDAFAQREQQNIQGDPALGQTPLNPIGAGLTQAGGKIVQQVPLMLSGAGEGQLAADASTTLSQWLANSPRLARVLGAGVHGTVAGAKLGALQALAQPVQDDKPGLGGYLTKLGNQTASGAGEGALTGGLIGGGLAAGGEVPSFLRGEWNRIMAPSPSAAINATQAKFSAPMAGEPPIPKIQSDLQGQFEAVKGKAKTLYQARDNNIQAALDANPAHPQTVELKPVVDLIDAKIGTNANAIAKNPTLEKDLQVLKENILNSQQKGTNTFQEVQKASREYRQQAHDLQGGATPNRPLAAEYTKVANALDDASNGWAKSLLGSDDTSVKAASNFYRDKVIPFYDRKTGIPDILNSNIPEQKLNSMLQGPSDKFSDFYNSLSPEGKQAVHAHMVNDAVDAAMVNGKLNPKIYAKSLLKNSKRLEAGFQNQINAINADPSIDPAVKVQRIQDIVDQHEALIGLPTRIQGMAPSRMVTGMSNAMAHVGGAGVGGAIGGAPGAFIGGWASEPLAEPLARALTPEPAPYVSSLSRSMGSPNAK